MPVPAVGDRAPALHSTSQNAVRLLRRRDALLRLLGKIRSARGRQLPEKRVAAVALNQRLPVAPAIVALLPLGMPLLGGCAGRLRAAVVPRDMRDVLRGRILGMRFPQQRVFHGGRRAAYCAGRWA